MLHEPRLPDTFPPKEMDIRILTKQGLRLTPDRESDGKDKDNGKH
jgi:hypothetical protein